MSTILMQIKGFKGNSTAANYKDWIEIDNLQFGGDRDVKMELGDLNNREHGRLSLNRVLLIKHLDRASNDLFMAMCNGTTFSQIEIHVCRGDKTLTPYAKFVLDKAMVSAHYTDVAGGADLIEEVELGFTRLQRTYVERDATNKSQSPNTVGYDLEAAKAM